MSAQDFYAAAVEEQARRLTSLARAALGRWSGDWGEPRLIKHRENAVFEVRAADGRRAALRVHRHGYHSDAELASELAWIRALDDAAIPVPRAIPSDTGALFVHATHPDVPEPRQVDLLAWVAGAPLGTSHEGPAQDVAALVRTYRGIGALAARVHGHGVDWLQPHAFKRHSWDRDGLIGPQPFWGAFLDLPALTVEQRALFVEAQAAAAADLDAYGTTPDRYGMIHADLVPENVFVDGERLALIDFDDAGFGWHMFELATALFFVLDHPAYPAIRDAVFEGYESERPGHADMARLPLFYFLRATTYVGWAHTREETETARAMMPSAIAATERYARAYLAS